jgi:hypothetical protein
VLNLPFVALALALASPAWSAGSAQGAVRCPIKASVAHSARLQWAFSGRTAASHTHGRGTWLGGRSAGTICQQRARTGRPLLMVVLSVVGSARLSPGMTRLGLTGVGLSFPVRVSASADSACPVGTRGTVSLFSSYHEAHGDSVRLHFSSGCSTHDESLTGSGLHVLIARDGQQVNRA